MIGSTLEATLKGQPVLILAVMNGTPNPKAIILHTNSKLTAVDITELDVQWHYDEKEGWLPDFPRE